jgi:hypothetical protein
MAELNFDQYKVRITNAIQQRIAQSSLPGEVSGFTLVDGFIMQAIQETLGEGLVLGGPAIPMVAIVGNATGRVYFFAFKALLPDVELP